MSELVDKMNLDFDDRLQHYFIGTKKVPGISFDE